jgi:hypothetical protein
VINAAAETSIKNHVHHYTTPCETVICDRRPHISPIKAILIFSINYYLFLLFEL